MLKKIILTIFILSLLFSWIGFTWARLAWPLAQIAGNSPEQKTEINFFYRQGCPHCAKAKDFLDELAKRYPEVKIKYFDIFRKESIDLLQKLYQQCQVPKQQWGLTPIIFTEKNYFLGFNNAIAQEIESCIEQCLGGPGSQPFGKQLSLPLIGTINPSQYSLPLLAIILGFFDGFNVCSLGALVLILALVLVLRNRKKILLFGSIFILSTALIYGFLIMLWYQIFSFFAPYLRAMEILIGFLGVGGGIYFLRQFIKFRKQGPVCEVKTDKGIISRFSSKIQSSLQGEASVMAVVLSILLFAAVITIVEFPCSAAVPVFFAGTLARTQLAVFYYLFYLSLFLLFYMLDEIVVFLLAFFTMTIKLTSNKFTTWFTLIEAIVLFLLGCYYLFGFLIF